MLTCCENGEKAFMHPGDHIVCISGCGDSQPLGYDQLLRITNRDFKIICYLLKSQDCYIIVKLLDLISDMFSCMVWTYLSLFYNNHNESKYIENIISNFTI